MSKQRWKDTLPDAGAGMSDLSGAMSWKDRIKDMDLKPIVVPTPDAYQQGRDDERAVLRPILTDLTGQLGGVHRYVADLDGEPRLCAAGCGVMPCASLRIADLAEERLRELDTRPQLANERINLGGER